MAKDLTKSQYIELFQDRETKLIFTKIKLAAANERIHNLERENQAIKENQQHPYMAKT